MGSIEAVEAVYAQIKGRSVSRYELQRDGQRIKTLLANVLNDDRYSLQEYLNVLEQISSKIDATSDVYLYTIQDQFLGLLSSVFNELEFKATLNQAKPTKSSVTSSGDDSTATPVSNTGPNPSPGGTVPQSSARPIISNRVFIVHGRDEAMKQTVARTLERIKLDPIILHEQSNAGRTIIEKFLDYSDVGCAVVLLTPDDMGVAVGDPTASARYRARQNVIFELGFFIGKIGRDRVFALYPPTNNFEFPSDFSGVIYIEYDRPDGAWRGQIAKELTRLGYDIDMNRLY